MLYNLVIILYSLELVLTKIQEKYFSLHGRGIVKNYRQKPN